MDPKNVAGLFYTPLIANFIKRQLSKKYKHRFTDEEIEIAIDKVVREAIPLEEVATFKIRKTRRKNITGESPEPDSNNGIERATSDNSLEQPKSIA